MCSDRNVYKKIYKSREFLKLFFEFLHDKVHERNLKFNSVNKTENINLSPHFWEILFFLINTGNENSLPSLIFLLILILKKTKKQNYYV